MHLCLCVSVLIIIFILFICLFQIQFLLVIIHASQLIFIQCDYPMVFVYVISSYAFIFIILFSNFYKKTYRTAKPSKTNGVSINGKTIGLDEGTKAKEN